MEKLVVATSIRLSKKLKVERLNFSAPGFAILWEINVFLHAKSIGKSAVENATGKATGRQQYASDMQECQRKQLASTAN